MSFNPKAVSVTDTPENYEALVYQNGEWVAASNPGVDPSQFGNWVLHEKIEFDNEPIGNVSVPIQGDKYDRIRVIAYQYDAVSDSQLSFRFNNDSGNNYYILHHYGGDTHTGGVYTGSEIRTSISKDYPGYADSTIVSPKAGKERDVHVLRHHYRSGTNNDTIQQMSVMWANTVDEITSLDFFDVTGSANTTGYVEIYVWQELKPVELHSYELIKEFNLDNETVDYTFDMAPDDDIVIKGSYYTVANGTPLINAVYFRPNGSSSSFVTESMYATGSNVGGNNNSVNGFLLGNAHDANRAVTFELNFQNINNGTKRQAITKLAYEDAGDERIYLINSVWGDTSTEIISGQVYCNANITGKIYVYKLAKTHLVSNNPGLLKGMWQEYSDADTVTVKPGQIEINGTNCYNSSDTDVTLSSNLRSGETESSDTYYYLYAIKGTGRTLTYKFSSVAPTMDRFGNSVSSFEDCDSEQDWYHPTEGRTWRYIGQVYNNSSSNIESFVKCKPGYWEGNWTSIPGTGIQTLNHYNNNRFVMFDLLFAKSATPSNYYIKPDYYETTTGLKYGVYNRGEITTTSIGILFGANGIFHDGSGWNTTGYYKLILKG